MTYQYDDCDCPICLNNEAVSIIPMPWLEDGRDINIAVMKFGILGIIHTEVSLDEEFCLRYFAIVHLPTKYLLRGHLDTYQEAYYLLHQMKHLPWDKVTIDFQPMEVKCFMRRQYNNDLLDMMEPKMGPRVLTGKRLTDYRKEQDEKYQALLNGIQ